MQRNDAEAKSQRTVNSRGRVIHFFEGEGVQSEPNANENAASRRPKVSSAVRSLTLHNSLRTVDCVRVSDSWVVAPWWRDDVRKRNADGGLSGLYAHERRVGKVGDRSS